MRYRRPRASRSRTLRFAGPHRVVITWPVPEYVAKVAGLAAARHVRGRNCGLVGVGALYMAAVLRLVAAVPLLPQGDPRLGESLALENT